MQLTLALSMSCSTSVRLEGFRYPGTDVSWPKYYRTHRSQWNRGYRHFIIRGFQKLWGNLGCKAITNTISS